MRARKPCLRLRRRTLGWNVRFMGCPLQVQHVRRAREGRFPIANWCTKGPGLGPRPPRDTPRGRVVRRVPVGGASRILCRTEARSKTGFPAPGSVGDVSTVANQRLASRAPMQRALARTQGPRERNLWITLAWPQQASYSSLAREQRPDRSVHPLPRWRGEPVVHIVDNHVDSRIWPWSTPGRKHQILT
jgi:hypothetical protein